ncbi:DUF1648 domain-containing protein [Antrihabitans spumae]|uniref:DUF1648 domain-containing protein n=1 Tax=Antrihabitans spumae TaxID=3373370 RepID=A0ABW7JQJ5_9NOCA
MKHKRLIDPVGLVFGIIVPILAAAVGIAVTALLKSRLPDQIATHWTAAKPDSFSEPMTFAWVFALVIVLVGGGCCAVAALAQALLLMRRAMLLLGLTIVGLLFTLQITILVIQLDRDSVTDVRLPWPVISLGVLAGILFGSTGAAMLRDFRVRIRAEEPPPPTLPRGVLASIEDTVGFSRIGSVVVATSVVAVAAIGCLFVDATWPLVATVPVVLVLLALMRFEVIVDSTGVRVRNFGLTSIDISIDEITGAKSIHVNPFKDYGGWGLRAKGRGRYGIVTTTGPAVEIGAASGLMLTITTQHADAMAGAINSFADRRSANVHG